MSKQKIIRSCLLFFLLTTIISVVPKTVHAQGMSPEEKKKKYQNWLEKDFYGRSLPILEMKLTTLSSGLCIDSPLKLELEITNMSDKDVVINLSKLWSQFSYSYSRANFSGKGGGMGINRSNLGTQTIVLQPGLTHWSTHEFPLAFDFFQEAGDYDLKTQVDGVFSNSVEFELYDCGKPQKIEDQ